MSAIIGDATAETRRRLDHAKPRSVVDIRGQAAALAAFSDGMTQQVAALKGFLFDRMYRHPKVTHTTDAAKQVVRALFAAFVADPAQLPPDWQGLCREDDRPRAVSTVRDYIAGMTDRFALQEYKRIIGGELPLQPS